MIRADSAFHRPRCRHSYLTKPQSVPFGPRGSAHVGVLRALEMQGIIPDVIVGTSAGGVVGALYAAGYSGNDLSKIALQMDESVFGD